MQSRIKSVRKALGLTQTEFGAKIAVKGNTITTYEKGTRVPSDAVIHSICQTFKVNEEWLRTGEGERFCETPMEESLMNLFSDVANDDNTFRKALFSVMSRMSLEEWEMLEAKANELLEEMQK